MHVTENRFDTALDRRVRALSTPFETFADNLRKIAA
jgi:hypothetical protein